jgi:hypothetical protein
MTMRTTSESLFERFCDETGIQSTRLPAGPSEGQRTPDYEIHLQVPPILAEVKQIDPNRDDRKLRLQLQDTGEYGFCDLPGKRLRDKISDAASQLRACAMPDQPALVVIYNNVDGLRDFTGPLQVMSAMYGLPQVVVTTTRGRGARVLWAESRLGGGRRLTPEHNTTLSAVATLFDGPEGPWLVVYHNRFASRPIPPEVMRRPRISQRCFHDSGAGNFPQWVEL